ncbi:MAG: hypothetical protein LBI29_03115 [Rickettsiales bacterium]|jgi:hypothetical protein|nr:hypothetical protein [Rickettsiales bacterium]
MLINDLRNGGKIILMLGTDNVAVALEKVLENFGNNILFWDPGGSGGVQYKSETSTSTAVEDIDAYPLESADCLILSQRLFFGGNDFLERFGKRIKKLEERVFLDVEIIKVLFYENKFIAIVGDSYIKVIHAALCHIFESTPRQAILLPSGVGGYPEIGEDGSESGLNLRSSNVFLMSLNGQNIQYLKNTDFDLVAVLSPESEQDVPSMERLLSKQAIGGVSIINVDNSNLKEFWSSPRSGNSATVLIPLSTDKMIENGYSYINETIYNYYDSNSSYDLANSGLIGSGINRLSVLLSFIVATRFGLDPSEITANLRLFQGMPGNMECVRRGSDGVLFVNNLCAETMDALESPFNMYKGIYAILVTNGKMGEAIVNLRNHRDSIKSIFLVDTFDMLDPKAEEFSGLNTEKVKDLEEAVSIVRSLINNNKNGDEGLEEEFVVLASPIYSDKMNNIHYRIPGEEFRRVVEGL